MIIYIKRIFSNKEDNYIIGHMELNDFTCDTLENYKLKIPDGTYTFNKAYHDKFKCNVFELEGVPKRSAILIHPGNTQKDTIGCILVGKNTVKGTLTDSRNTLDRLIMLHDYYTVATASIIRIDS